MLAAIRWTAYLRAIVSRLAAYTTTIQAPAICRTNVVVTIWYTA